jgi:putative endopeptidase
MKTRLFVIALFFIGTYVVSCSSGSEKKEAQGQDALASHIDSTVLPGNDFFLYANGKWFKQNPIPASEQSNGIWQLIQDTINAQVRQICESSASIKNAEQGSNKQKIGDFFFTGMDSLARNKNGINDLKSEFDIIDGITDATSLFKVISHIHATSGAPVFRFFVGQDDKISSKNAAMIMQGGISLPDRNYYFDTDARTVAIREKYVEYVGNLYKIMGLEEALAKKAATNFMKLETDIAKFSRKQEETRDPLTNYNKFTLKKLSELYPELKFSVFFENMGLSNIDTVIVGQPEFLKALNTFVKKYSITDWKNYLKLQLLNSMASYLDDKVYSEFFSFYYTTMSGVTESKPRWERVVGQTDLFLGELIGQVYVNEYLPKGTKEKLQEIGNAIKDVYAGRIRNLDWMSNVTKEKAIKKLNTMIMKVGYPDKWKDLSSLQVDRGSFAKNVLNAKKWKFNYMISRFGKPVDRTEWGMQPQTYNAYYNPSNNEIVVPGCNILVPGYERKMADDAILYSIIGGSTFGHEMTHGFDDQGCKYNELGNLENWWTPEDSAKFFSKTKMIVKQFNDYIAVDSLHINGSFTQGENIADLGGVIMGYEAFKKTEQYKKQEQIGGLNPDKRFFLAYALAWMTNERPEAIANQVKSNEHSPAKFRVLGPLSNITDFYTAFALKKGDAMWRDENIRIKIW